jgi:hypothetical protein
VDGTSAPGVALSQELLAYADASLAENAGALAAARSRLVAVAGVEAMIDAAAVIAGFDGITRIADATGIPLEPPKAEQTADLRATLRLDQFAAAKW